MKLVRLVPAGVGFDSFKFWHLTRPAADGSHSERMNELKTSRPDGQSSKSSPQWSEGTFVKCVGTPTGNEVTSLQNKSFWCLVLPVWPVSWNWFYLLFLVWSCFCHLSFKICFYFGHRVESCGCIFLSVSKCHFSSTWRTSGSGFYLLRSLSSEYLKVLYNIMKTFLHSWKHKNPER